MAGAKTALGDEAKHGRGRERCPREAAFQRYMSTLGRSARTTLAKQVDRAITKARIRVCTVRAAGLSLEHFSVIFSHERRALGLVRGLFVSLIRWVAAAAMTGFRDEYRVDGRLVAFSHFIIKGRYMRAMWFYQETPVSRCMIWFHALRSNVRRACHLDHVSIVDAGPSFNDVVKRVKTKFGFESVLGWKLRCDFSGKYLRSLPQGLLFRGSSDGGGAGEGAVAPPTTLKGTRSMGDG